MPYQTIKIKVETLKKLRLLSAHTNLTMVELLDRLISKDLTQYEGKNTNHLDSRF